MNNSTTSGKWYAYVLLAIIGAAILHASWPMYGPGLMALWHSPQARALLFLTILAVFLGYRPVCVARNGDEKEEHF